MDINDSFEADQQGKLAGDSPALTPLQQQLQQQQQMRYQQQQLQQQQSLLYQQQMQCDPIYTSANGYNSTETYGPHMPLELPMQTAIPMPAPQQKIQTQHPQQATTTTTTAIGATTTPVVSGVNSNVDIDSLLLQQFSCLGTTDHEDLVNQFQSLMDNQMNADSARFFLEMSNWNLQTAVGYYIDYCNSQNVPSLKVVRQAAINGFQQAWQLLNDGNEDWPKDCYLMSPTQTQRIPIPYAIRPGDTIDIVADVPPSQPPVMWRLCTPNGWYFGEPIWMIAPGECTSPTDLAERMSQLRTSVMKPENYPQIKIVWSFHFK